MLIITMYIIILKKSYICWNKWTIWTPKWFILDWYLYSREDFHYLCASLKIALVRVGILVILRALLFVRQPAYKAALMTRCDYRLSDARFLGSASRPKKFSIEPRTWCSCNTWSRHCCIPFVSPHTGSCIYISTYLFQLKRRRGCSRGKCTNISAVILIA